MKYLQAWAADRAGNISVFPAKAFINFLPPLQQVAQNERHVYRFSLDAGAVLSVRLEPVNGDPDLYIWAPDHETRAPWISNLRDAVDDLELTAPIAGNYQVEVNGFSAADYRLIVAINSTNVSAVALAGGVDPTKQTIVPSLPPLSDESVPSDHFAVNTPGTSAQRLFLPLIQR